MNRIFVFACVSLLFFGCETLTYEKSFNRLVENIKQERKGIVTSTFSPRENMEPTHFVINSIDTIVPTNSLVMDGLYKGDKILKSSSDNIIKIFKSDTLFKKTWMYKIPEKYRQDVRFPTDWKTKWIEATAK